MVIGDPPPSGSCIGLFTLLMHVTILSMINLLKIEFPGQVKSANSMCAVSVCVSWSDSAFFLVPFCTLYHHNSPLNCINYLLTTSQLSQEGTMPCAYIILVVTRTGGDLEG